MAASESTIVAVSIAAVVASGPLYEVFNEMGLLMAAMGGLGGALYVLRHDVPWSKAVKPVITGAIFSFGAGVWAVPLVGRFVGIEVADTPHTVPAMAGAAFFAGFLQERLLSRMGQKKGDGDGQN